MNERVKELLREAGGLNFGEDGEELAPSLVGESVAYFAELIVKECADVGERYAEGIDLGSMLYLYTEDIEDTIKKHFGVDE